MEGADDEGIGHGHDGPCLPPTRGQTLGQRAQSRPFGPGDGLRDWGQARAQGAMAPAGLARVQLAGTHIAAGG
jgi:hypothetical protein